MTVAILRSKSEIKEARRELRRKDISCTEPLFVRFLRNMRLSGGINVGDNCKSWDVLTTLQFIDKTLSRDAAILDMGAYASEVICALHKMGYSHLSGVDLNPDVIKMPFSDKINYFVGNFMKMPVADNSMSAVTAISVIEHGFDTRRLLPELQRILKRGGYFIASVDYWPDKIDTHGLQIFGMDWIIFSKQDLLSFFEEAAKYGFTPYGEMFFEAEQHLIKWNKKSYTFAWLVLKKA